LSGATAPPPVAAGPSRLASLDAFRGLAMAAMVLVNNPGDWSTVYPPLLHAEWHGWTPTDLVFPFFLVIVGVAMTFSKRTSVMEAARRALILIGLGLFLAAFPHFELATLRWPGVLQRIGVVFFLAFLVRRYLGRRAQVALAVGILVGYGLLLTRVPIPDGTAPNLEPGTNLAAWVDRAAMGGHLWKSTRTWDPEGLLSTLPALVSVLLGAFAGDLLRAPLPARFKTGGFLAGGAALAALGHLWGLVLPINKALWTSSYVLFSGGWALVVFGLLHFVVDVRGHRTWARPLVVFGRNAILLFVGSGLLARILYVLEWKRPVYDAAFRSWLPPYPASLAFALANLALWYGILFVLDRRRIYLKV
jgi:predicted acyltransferase